MLSQLSSRALPARPPLRALLGPGLVWMALAQGSGELIFWPQMIAKYGLAFLFLRLSLAAIVFVTCVYLALACTVFWLRAPAWWAALSG